MSASVPQDTAELLDGTQMPPLGFGTWKLTGDDARRAVVTALRACYRHLDTATIYRNEREVGAGLSESRVPRDEVFVTTKCPPRNAGREVATLRESLAALGTDHVDLWLVHWPQGDGADLAMWEAFVEAREQGLARSIGVSNYTLRQVDELTERAGVTPVVNQVKWSPLLFDRATLDGHRERRVVLEGYSTLRGGTLKNAAVRAVAQRHGRTPAQVLVRWHLQHGVVVIPKSSQEDRIRSNADVADLVLTEADMAELDALGA
jgi:diketogulonate reductase-like aldo/keto reductase